MKKQKFYTLTIYVDGEKLISRNVLESYLKWYFNILDRLNGPDLAALISTNVGYSTIYIKQIKYAYIAAEINSDWWKEAFVIKKLR
jgi:hypothetical protein